VSDFEELVHRLSHDETVRYAALELAIGIDDSDSAAGYVATAKHFEQYIRGNP
jgi:hypothetical protein